MIHPIKSLEARKRRYLSQNYKKTKYGKIFASLKDKYSGETCFLIGNGPSLSPEDLTVLHNNNIKTFASNRIYNTYDETPWRTDFLVSEDEYVLEEIQDCINEMECEYKFIPIHLKWYKNINIKNAYYFNQSFYKNGDVKKFSDNISEDIVCRGTVITTCAQIAIHMGFKRMYLVGVDHNFSRMTDKDGNLIINNDVKDHYGVEKNADENTKGIFNVDNATQAFMDLKEFAEARGVEIYNATRGGKLEVFPRVDFDDLFNEKEL